MTKIDNSVIRTLSTSEVVPVIIMQNSLCINSLKRAGVEILKEYPFINAVACNANTIALNHLEKDNNVSFIASQNTIKLVDGFTSEITSSTNNEINKTSYEFFSGLMDCKKSRFESVAIIDTGICPHVDFMCPKIKIRHFQDFVGGQIFPYDDNGHGTFVSGVLSNSGLSSAGKIGCACPQADLVVLKAMNHKGEGESLQILDAMQWVMDNRLKYKISTVCMSFGTTPQRQDPLARGAMALTNAGLSVCCASGNSGEGKVLSPAIYQNAISVGAVDNDGVVAEFSSRGVVGGIRKPEFYAMGVEVKGLANDKLYATMSGTSVACPYVAGIVHKLRTEYPFMPPHQIKAGLYRIADKKNGLHIL